MTTEKHILPSDDDTVADLTADILETLAARQNVSESSESGEVIVHQDNRRFRVQLIEIPA